MVNIKNEHTYEQILISAAINLILTNSPYLSKHKIVLNGKEVNGFGLIELLRTEFDLEDYET